MRSRSALVLAQAYLAAAPNNHDASRFVSNPVGMRSTASINIRAQGFSRATRVNCSRFFFVHIPKVGGSTVEQTCRDETSDLSRALRELQWSNHIPMLGISNVLHRSADKLRALIGGQVWDELLTFAVVRNPFAWVVSIFFFWLQSKCPNTFPSQYMVCAYGALLPNESAPHYLSTARWAFNAWLRTEDAEANTSTHRKDQFLADTVRGGPRTWLPISRVTTQRAWLTDPAGAWLVAHVVRLEDTANFARWSTPSGLLRTLCNGTMAIRGDRAAHVSAGHAPATGGYSYDAAHRRAHRRMASHAPHGAGDDDGEMASAVDAMPVTKNPSRHEAHTVPRSPVLILSCVYCIGALIVHISEPHGPMH